MNIKILTLKFCDHATFFNGYSEATTRRYKSVIKNFCNHTSIQNIEEITESNVRNFFFSGRMNRNWGANTFIQYHKTLGVFFRWCIKEKFMENNPTNDIEIPKLPKRIPPKLTKEEAMRILEVAYNYPYKYKFLRSRNHAIFSTFLFSGVRKKELLDLKLTDIDIEHMSIFIRQGKGNKDRVIPINYRLADILIKYLTERKRMKKTCPEFFVSLNRNKGFTESGMKRMVDSIRDASGIKFTVHKLRHTFATLMLEGGCDIYSLSKMMGHNDIKTTTIYLAASVQHLRSEISKHPLNDI